MQKRRARSMNRRDFVQRASMVAAGSALGVSPLGCAANQITSVIPCLVPALAPTPVAGMTYLTASQIGCALDCDLTTGLNKKTGGPATDDGPTINAAMAGASASHPITLILDGVALISGLFLPAGGYWSIAGLGCGTGFFIKSGTNNDGIHNGGPTAAVPSDPGPNTPLPSRGSSVSLSNFTLNGNQGNGLTGDSTTGAPQGDGAHDVWYYCINLMNLNNIMLTNVVVVNAPAYHFRLSNVGNVTVKGCVMKSAGANTDGLHFDGPANDITISNCDFTCQDDAIALNCPEGHDGNISRVAITDCTFNSNSLARLYTINTNNSPYKFTIDTVTVTNCSGICTIAGFLIGQGAGGAPNSIGSLTVTDCQITTPALLDAEVNFGTITLTRVRMTPWIANPDRGFGFLRTSGAFAGMTYTGAALIFNDCSLVLNSDITTAAVILENSSVIQRIEFNGFSMLSPAGSNLTASQLIDTTNGSVGQLLLDALDATHIAAPTSPVGFAKIGQVLGGGVLATGWPFPDSVMADGTPYLSATTHQPSIKIGGVVQPYP